MNEPTREIIINYGDGNIDSNVKNYIDDMKDKVVSSMVEYVQKEMDKKKDETVKKVKNDDSDDEETQKFKNKIKEKYVFPHDEESIETLLSNKKFYAGLLQFIRIVKLFLAMLVVPILLFSNAKFSNYDLTFYAGIVSICVGAFEAADQAISRTNKKRVEKINSLLESIQVKHQIIDITPDETPPHKKQEIDE